MAKLFSQVVTDVAKEVDDVYATKHWKQTIIDIEMLINMLNGLWTYWKQFHEFTSDELSRIGGRLAVLRSSLTEPRYECFKNVQTIKIDFRLHERTARDRAKEDAEAVSGKKSATVDDIKVRMAKYLAEYELRLRYHEAFYEKLQSYWYSIPDVLYRIETRIKILADDRDTVKFYGDSDLEWNLKTVSESYAQIKKFNNGLKEEVTPSDEQTKLNY